MAMNMGISTFVFFFLLASYAEAQWKVFDIRKYGVSPHGDITEALINAWKDACASTSESIVLIPRSTYKLRQVDIRGPCKAPINVQVYGIILAPADPNQLKGNAPWVRFGYLNLFTLSGGGTFDGRGQTAWKQNDCRVNKNCKKLSMNLGFDFLNNSIIRYINSKDSKSFHVNVFGCKNVTFTNLNIIAPANSPNTDGVHIGRSSEINITKSNIGTGDDCISLGDGSKLITILSVTCGPGHGISVGSLGLYPNEETVEGFLVKNCILKNTENGLRIKTWPGTKITSIASELHYEDIIVINVRNPIIIDQEYCPNGQCSRQTPSKVRINKVSFKNIRGTSATKNGVTLICSGSVPCEDVELSNINLTFKGAPATAKCANVKPIIEGNAPTCVA